MDHRDIRPDEKDRSQFGAYAQSARAELNGSRDGLNETHATTADVDQGQGVEVAPANNNTAPSRRGDSEVVILPAVANGGGSREPLRASSGNAWIETANGTANGAANGIGEVSFNGYVAARPATKQVKPAVSEANVISLPFADPLHGAVSRPDLNRSGQTTVTMTRETATFTIPASEATLPPSLLAAGEALPRVRSAAASAIDTVTQSAPHTGAMTAPIAVPPPLPTKPAMVLSPPPLPSSSPEPTENSEVIEAGRSASPEDFSESHAQTDFDFSEDFDNEDFDVFHAIHEDDEEATRSIAHRLKPSNRA